MDAEPQRGRGGASPFSSVDAQRCPLSRRATPEVFPSTDRRTAGSQAPVGRRPTWHLCRLPNRVDGSGTHRWCRRARRRALQPTCRGLRRKVSVVPVHRPPHLILARNGEPVHSYVPLDGAGLTSRRSDSRRSQFPVRLDPATGHPAIFCVPNAAPRCHALQCQICSPSSSTSCVRPRPQASATRMEATWSG